MEAKLRKDFYVYAHISNTTGKVFYIGKGSGRRAFSKKGRNTIWKSIAKSGFTVKIIKDHLFEECAFSFEKIIINSIGVENLSNLTSGGEGTSGWVPSREFRERLSEIRKGIPPHPNARAPDAIFRRIEKLRGKKHSEDHKRKIGDALRGRARDKTRRYKFYHPDHGCVTTTISCLMSKYNLDRNVRNMAEGKIKSTKGWSLYCNRGRIGNPTGEAHHAADNREFIFRKGEMCFVGSKYEFSKKFDIKLSYVSRLVRGERKVSYGWKIDRIEGITSSNEANTKTLPTGGA